MRYAPPPSDESFPDRSRAERGSERGARRPSLSDPMVRHVVPLDIC